jgi:DNA repair protein RadC
MTTATQQTIFDYPAKPRTLAETPLCHWPVGERPVERMYVSGPTALSDIELLAVLLHGANGGTNAVALAQQLITMFGSWHGLQQASLEDLTRVPGLGRARAAQIKAVHEIARRLLLAPPGERLQIKSPTDVATLLMLEMSSLEQEHLRTVCLDTKNRLQTVHTVYIGSLNTAVVRVGEVYREALKRNSSAIIVCHNHPSGDPQPSPEDVLLTREIVAAGQLLDIDCLDHLVIGQGRFVSMRERGLGFTR